VYWIGVNLDIEERKQPEFYLAEVVEIPHPDQEKVASAIGTRVP
jgi:hypothetical protein